MSTPEPGRMTVEIYVSDEELGSIKRAEDVGVLAAVISHGDNMVQISMDEERGKWEIEVVGGSTIYHT